MPVSLPSIGSVTVSASTREVDDAGSITSSGLVSFEISAGTEVDSLSGADDRLSGKSVSKAASDIEEGSAGTLLSIDTVPATGRLSMPSAAYPGTLFTKKANTIPKHKKANRFLLYMFFIPPLVNRWVTAKKYYGHVAACE